MRRFVLREVGGDEPLYWSNEDGWVDLTTATVFREDEFPVSMIGEFDVVEL